MKKLKRNMTVGVLIGVMSLMLMGCGKEAPDGIVDITNYIDVEFEGENGSGKATVNIDYDGLELELVGGKDALEEMDSVEDLEELSQYINVVAGISFSIDQSSDLSNGDTVTVTATYDEKTAEEAQVVFGENLSKSFEVTGLK
ncbi:MAG: hypothetical protein J6Z06_03045 [Lachnospiraceae bacterium]|nr:hypothetical protein [Lachnospiraceae bacterium]